jgi:hypothetical protein
MALCRRRLPEATVGKNISRCCLPPPPSPKPPWEQEETDEFTTTKTRRSLGLGTAPFRMVYTTGEKEDSLYSGNVWFFGLLQLFRLFYQVLARSVE